MKKILSFILLSISFLCAFSQSDTLLNKNGKFVKLNNLYVLPPLYRVDDSTITSVSTNYWKLASVNTIYHDSGTVTIYNDTVGVTANGSSGLILQNRTAATVSVPVSAAAMSFIGNTWITGGGARSVPTEWRIVPVAYLGTTGSLDFRFFLNGVAGGQTLTIGQNLVTYNAMTGANFTASGTSTLNAVNISGVTTIGHTFFGGYATYDNLLLNPNYTISSGGTTTKGFYNAIGIKQTAAGLNNSKLGGFSNNIGENRFTTTGLDRSGFGITDSVNGSAVVEVRTATSTGLVGGFLLPRVTKVQRNNIISSLLGTITAGGSAYNGIANNVVLTGGSGTGATADIGYTSGSVSYVWIRNIGSGYKVGDVLSATLQGGSGFTYTISAVGAPAVGLEVYQTDNTEGPRWYTSSGWATTAITIDP